MSNIRAGMSRVLTSEKAEEAQSPLLLQDSGEHLPLFPPKKLCRFRTTDSNLAVGKRRNKLPFNTAKSFVSTSFVFPCPCLHLACKWTWQPFCYFILFMRLNVQLWGELEEQIASLCASLQSSFMSLSLAQWFTSGPPLSLLTLLHTELCCCPQQHIDMLLRLWLKTVVYRQEVKEYTDSKCPPISFSSVQSETLSIVRSPCEVE